MMEMTCDYIEGRMTKGANLTEDKDVMNEVVLVLLKWTSLATQVMLIELKREGCGKLCVGASRK